MATLMRNPVLNFQSVCHTNYLIKSKISNVFSSKNILKIITRLESCGTNIL